MANLWHKLTQHRGNGWWNLPHTPSNEPNPPHEGPIGGAWFGNWWTVMTHGGVSHAGPKFYWLVGFILAVITLLEVWAFAIEGLAGWYVPILLVLAIAKFVGVVAYFMHLRFEKALYTYFFAAAMIVGVFIFAALMFLMEYAHQEPLF